MSPAMKTCRRLWSLSKISSYWHYIARNVTLPLPIPPGLTLSTLPPHNLRTILLKHDRSTKNLACQEPKIQKHRVLPLPESQNSVAYPSFIHDGTRFLILYWNGLLQLWDIVHRNPDQPIAGPACEIVIEADTRPTSVGVLLAEHDTGLAPHSLNFATCERSGDIIVAVASQLT